MLNNTSQHKYFSPVFSGVCEEEESLVLRLSGGGEVDLVSSSSADVDLVSGGKNILSCVQRLLIGSGNQEGEEDRVVAEAHDEASEDRVDKVEILGGLGSHPQVPHIMTMTNQLSKQLNYLK